MRLPAEILHGARHRPLWLLAAAVLALVAGWFAFVPDPPPGPDFNGVDKVHHLLAFSSMALATALGFAPLLRARMGVAAALLGYGAVIEIVQSQIPGRSASVADLAADACGIAAGLAAAQALRRWLPAPVNGS